MARRRRALTQFVTILMAFGTWFVTRTSHKLVRRSRPALCANISSQGKGGRSRSSQKTHASDGMEEARFVPVGAIVAPLRMANIVLRLAKGGWNKRRNVASGGWKRSILPYDGPTTLNLSEKDTKYNRLLSVHLSPEASWALLQPDARERVPKELWRLLEEGLVEWKPGLRIGSKECGGPSNVLRCLPPIRESARFSFVELFAGIGGFRLAMESFGGQCVMASETDPLAKETYSGNFGDVPVGDICEVVESHIPHHDVLTAGFPCQAFSAAGEQQGFADRNGNLFFEVTRVLRGCQPKAFLLENVPALYTLDDGRVMKVMLEELRKAGYRCTWNVLRSNAIVPQKRRRIYFVGLRNDLVSEEGNNSMDLEFEWPQDLLLASEGGKHFTDEDANFPTVGDILEEDVSDSYDLSQDKWDAIMDRERNNSRDPVEFRIVSPRDQARTIISSYRRSHEWNSQYVRRSDSMNESTPPRFFTEREIARLQGFPDSFELGKCSSPKRLYHQLGNAVCPLVVARIAENLLKAAGL
ncbi:hypothetical protein AAMO2058_000051200 [Amorphochlora amoebiformis]